MVPKKAATSIGDAHLDHESSPTICDVNDDAPSERARIRQMRFTDRAAYTSFYVGLKSAFGG